MPRDAGDPSAPGSILSLAYLRVNAFTKPENYGIPRGGMSQLPFAMARYAKSLGVEIKLNTVVDKVIVEDGTAVGVRLENGEEIRSFMVVSNADPKRTYRDLVDEADVDAATKAKVDGLSTRANCVKLLVALRELPDFSSYLGEGYDPRLTAYFRICPLSGLLPAELGRRQERLPFELSGNERADALDLRQVVDAGGPPRALFVDAVRTCGT